MLIFDIRGYQLKKPPFIRTPPLVRGGSVNKGGGFLIIDFAAGGGKFSHFELKNVPRKARFQSQNIENIVQKCPNFRLRR